MTNTKIILSQNNVNSDVHAASASHKLKDRHIRMIALGGVIGRVYLSGVQRRSVRLARAC
ncbi:hypothetical protein [Sorlinia euscelidii]